MDKKTLKLFLLLLFPCLLFFSQGIAQEENSAFAYRIDALLNAAEWIIDGTQQVTVFNRTANPTDRVVFHLPTNALANEDSIKASKLDPCARNIREAEAKDFGYMDILSVALETPAGELGPIEIKHDIMEVPLKQPLAPNQSVTLKIAFRTKLPSRAFLGTGVHGAHIIAIHWYPRLGFLRDDGWIIDQLEGVPCFMSDFGEYQVTLSLPGNYQVDGTGVILEEATENARKKVTFEAKSTLDFAWTADILSSSEKHLYTDVEISLLGQPFMKEKLPSILETAKNCMNYFTRTFAPYPYKRFVITTSPHGCSGTHYSPMFASISQGCPTHVKTLLKNAEEPNNNLIEAMTHQYFFSSLVSRDKKDAWLAKSLARFAQLKLSERLLKEDKTSSALRSMEKKVFQHVINNGFGLYPQNRPSEGLCCSRFKPHAQWINLNSCFGFIQSPFHSSDEPSLLGYKIRSSFDYAALRENYEENRGALCLLTLEKQVGSEKLEEAFKEFVTRHRFKHPGVDEFLGALKEKAGPEAESFAKTLFNSKSPMDYSIVSAQCKLDAPPRGYPTQNKLGKREAFEATDMAEPRSLWSKLYKNSLYSFGARPAENQTQTPDSKKWRYEVIAANHSSLVLPVKILLRFEKDVTEEKVWDGAGGLLRLSGVKEVKLLSATIDPMGKYALDINRLNNSRSVQFHSRGVLFCTAWLQFWIQNNLNGWALIN